MNDHELINLGAELKPWVDISLAVNAAAMSRRQGDEGPAALILRRAKSLRALKDYCERTGSKCLIGIKKRSHLTIINPDTRTVTAVLPAYASRIPSHVTCSDCGSFALACLLSCNHKGCTRYICHDCASRVAAVDSYLCPRHKWDAPSKPVERYLKVKGFAMGVEIECETTSCQTRQLAKTSPLIAGWGPDLSLPRGGLEYQTQPLGMGDVPKLTRLVAQLPENTKGQAGGHVHVARTDRQTPGRWYHALAGLTDGQCERLNMRHHLPDNHGGGWCHLVRGDYFGKRTAVNDSHSDTIELRTFGAWDKRSAGRLPLVAEWLHGMWRLFDSHPRRTLRNQAIEAYARRLADQVLTEPRKPLQARLAEHRMRKAERNAARQLRIWMRVRTNVELSRKARRSHGQDWDAVAWQGEQVRKTRRRDAINARLANTSDVRVIPCWPTELNGARCARVLLANPDLTLWDLRPLNVVTGDTCWMITDACVVEQVVCNVKRSRKARASHGRRQSYDCATTLRILRRLGKADIVQDTNRWGEPVSRYVLR